MQLSLNPHREAEKDVRLTPVVVPEDIGVGRFEGWLVPANAHVHPGTPVAKIRAAHGIVQPVYAPKKGRLSIREIEAREVTSGETLGAVMVCGPGPRNVQPRVWAKDPLSYRRPSLWGRVLRFGLWMLSPWMILEMFILTGNYGPLAGPFASLVPLGLGIFFLWQLSLQVQRWWYRWQEHMPKTDLPSFKALAPIETAAAAEIWHPVPQEPTALCQNLWLEKHWPPAQLEMLARHNDDGVALRGLYRLVRVDPQAGVNAAWDLIGRDRFKVRQLACMVIGKWGTREDLAFVMTLLKTTKYASGDPTLLALIDALGALRRRHPGAVSWAKTQVPALTTRAPSQRWACSYRGLKNWLFSTLVVSPFFIYLIFSFAPGFRDSDDSVANLLWAAFTPGFLFTAIMFLPFLITSGAADGVRLLKTRYERHRLTQTRIRERGAGQVSFPENEAESGNLSEPVATRSGNLSL